MAKLSRSEIVEISEQITSEFQAQGLLLTVRQLFYQFVIRGLIENTKQNYKRIVNALSLARLEGRFPIDRDLQ